MSVTDFTLGEYGFPGPQRDRLNAAICSGAKTATASLLLDYGSDPLPFAGQHEIVVDSDGRPVAVTRTTAVDVVPLASVTDDFAHAEGEGFADATAWRAAHEAFWREACPDIPLDDATEVVLQRFVLVSVL